jgi:predicted DNA-binding transcriptional regulator AlpA
MSSWTTKNSSVKMRPPVERLAYRINELSTALGLSRRAIERARVAARFPKADIQVGRCPLWRVETVKAWLEGGGI